MLRKKSVAVRSDRTSPRHMAGLVSETPRISRRAAARAAAASALFCLTTPRLGGAQETYSTFAPASGDAQVDLDTFRKLPPCKREEKIGDWEVVAFIGLYGVRLTTVDWATFGYARGLESEEEAAVDVSRGLRERLVSDPSLAALAAQASRIVLSAGGETQVIETDLTRLLAFEELRIKQVDYDAPEAARPETTAWLLQKAEYGETLELILEVGPDNVEVGRDRLDLSDFSEAFAAAAAFSDTLQEENRLLECDRTKKVVCSAMNRAYGFGAFRNAVWLRYSERLTPAHERGYHALALPMIRFAYGGETGRRAPARRALRAALEHLARERTADIWAEMRGGRRRWRGRLYRAVLEPLCWAVGRLRPFVRR